MNYWLHRCKHEGGFDILDRESRLTIGFADCAKNEDMVDCIRKKDGIRFDEVYRKIYDGDLWRARYGLWRFTCEMAAGDIVVVPRDGGFSICRLIGEVLVSERKQDHDIGFEWQVEMLAPMCSPRDAYAPTGLLSRMKCRQTNLAINDLVKDVDSALTRFKNKKPFELPKELSKKCHELLDGYGSSDHFEQLLRDYFLRLGAQAEILPKNSTDKNGDCDVSAVFPALRLTISVQAKKHWGTTGDDAVRQIIEYANAKESTETEEANWTYANWVVSFADDFSDEAKTSARENGVILINGDEFCRMLISNGLGYF